MIEHIDNLSYFNLKIGKGNYLAEEWLARENYLKRPAAVIFFGPCTIQQISSGAPEIDKQAIDFYLNSLPENRHKTVITVIKRGKGWIIQPSGDMEEHHPTTRDSHNLGDLWKVVPVKIAKEFLLKDIPHILAGINSNAYLGRGTYRPISYWGTIKSIHYVLGLPFPADHLKPENCTPKHLLECLSSLELETLVAKIFEAAGCFVSAYRGGYIPDIDLFARNNGTQKINLDGIEISPNERVTIQVKGLNKVRSVAKEVSYFIGLDAPKLDNGFNANWIYNQVNRYLSVSAWLKNSLYWLPKAFQQKFPTLFV
jgi:hypothetical protein